MNQKIIVVLCAVVLALNVMGCAGQQPMVDQVEITAPVVVDPSKSYVYFYRPCIVKSTTKTVRILDKIKQIGVVNCGTYMVYETEPGKHTFNANDWFGEDHPFKMELEAGKKYFVEIDLRISVMDSISPLKLMEDVSEGDLSDLKHVSGK